MIFAQSVLRSAPTVTNGSALVHLAMLVALWVCVEPIAADDNQFISGMTRPRSLMIAVSAVHVLILLS